MSPNATTTSNKKSSDLPSKRLLSAVASLTRWKILNEMSAGEGMMVSTLATRIGASATNVSKHMLMLLKAGLVRIGPGRLYHLTDLSRPDPTTNEVDLGAIVLRLPRRKG